jgi:uncharacterized protein DUF6131
MAAGQDKGVKDSCALTRELVDWPGVIIIGIVLLVLGFLLGIYFLWVAGAILLVIGLVLLLAGRGGRTVGGRSHWY